MTARTGQWDDGLDWTARTGQLGQHNRRGLWGQDSENDKDRTAKSGQDSQIMKAWVTWQLGQNKWDRKSVEESKDRTARTGQLVQEGGKDSREITVWRGQPRQGCVDWSAWPGQGGQVG
jgi:hypothetical protein